MKELKFDDVKISDIIMILTGCVGTVGWVKGKGKEITSSGEYRYFHLMLDGEHDYRVVLSEKQKIYWISNLQRD